MGRPDPPLGEVQDSDHDDSECDPGHKKERCECHDTLSIAQRARRDRDLRHPLVSCRRSGSETRLENGTPVDSPLGGSLGRNAARAFRRGPAKRGDVLTERGIALAVLMRC